MTSSSITKSGQTWTILYLFLIIHTNVPPGGWANMSEYKPTNRKWGHLEKTKVIHVTDNLWLTDWQRDGQTYGLTTNITPAALGLWGNSNVFHLICTRQLLIMCLECSRLVQHMFCLLCPGPTSQLTASDLSTLPNQGDIPQNGT